MKMFSSILTLNDINIYWFIGLEILEWNSLLHVDRHNLLERMIIQRQRMKLENI